MTPQLRAPARLIRALPLAAAALALFSLGCAKTAAVIKPTSGMTKLAPDVRVEQLAPGVWLHQSDKVMGNGAVIPANGLLVADGDAGVLIDAGWNVQQTGVLLAWAKELGHPVHTLVVTHAHDDRISGVPAAQKAGIRAVGHPLTRELGMRLFEFGPEPLPELAEGGPVTVGPVELYFPGAGHAPDNIVAWIPSANILFGGCLIKDGRSESLGYTGDADLENWPKAVEAVQKAYPAAQRVVPGHGLVGDATLLAHTREILTARRK